MSETNDMQPPAWMNQSFLEKALAEKLKTEDMTITTVNITPAVGKGDNIASQIFRTRLELDKAGQQLTLSFIIKILPPGESMQEVVYEMDVFNTEALMLSKVVPELHRLLGNDSTVEKLAAKCYYSQGPPNDLIIMEDLCESGYRIANRHLGLDLDHSYLAIKSLATYHAGMIILMETKFKELALPHTKQTFWSRGFSHRNSPFISFAMKSIAEVFRNVKPSEAMAKKMDALVDTIQEKVYEVWEFDAGCKLNTYLHGDCWLNNAMFKYDENGKVSGHVFVDYQIGSYNSAMLDLQYFIFTSVQIDLRIPNIDNFLKIYYDTFTSVFRVKNKKFDLTFNELKEEFIRKSFFGLTALLTVFPVVRAPTKEAIDPNDMYSDNETSPSNAQAYQNKNFLEILKNSLSFFEENGVF